MTVTLKNSWFSLDAQRLNPDLLSEHLCEDSPFDRTVAEPLFVAGVACAAMACRKGYQSKRLYEAGCHMLTLLLQGRLTVQHDDIVTSMQPGELAYCPPQSMTRYESESEEVTWWLYFKIHDTVHWKDLKKVGPFVIRYDSAELMFVLLRRILDAKRSQELSAVLGAVEDSEMLLRLLRRLWNAQKNRDSRVRTLQSLVSDIAKDPSDSWSQAKMAAQVFVSPRTLLRLFQKEYGCAPLDMVVRQRMMRAMHLIMTSDMSVAEVADRCGYRSVSSFCRIFHRQLGVTPGQYRRKAGLE